MKNLKRKIALFLECFLNWKIKADIDYDIEKTHIYFCLSFGYQKNNPGTNNQELALFLEKYYLQKRAIIVAQKEIAEVLPEVLVNFVISKHQKSDKYLDTFEVCRQCFNYCRDINLKKILIFVHPHHVWRTKKTLEKFGMDVFVADTTGCPYDPESAQIWTRTKLFFIPRELLTRLYYLFSGKI